MTNYPPGTGPNDPRAPWNQPDPVFVECGDCGGTGLDGHDCGEDTCCCLHPEDNVTCETCNGSGEVEEYEE